MKNFIYTLLIIIFCNLTGYAEEPKEIQFIYINGSNNNDKKMTKWFYDGMNKLHPKMREAFLNSDYIKDKLLNNGTMSISTEPEAFFWGNKSSDEIEYINSDLNITKMFSPKLAQRVRSFMAHCLHDAIWVSHYRNMHPVVEDLHLQIMNNYKKGKQVVFLQPNEVAEAVFDYQPESMIYSYCNIHGLWAVEVK